MSHKIFLTLLGVVATSGWAAQSTAEKTIIHSFNGADYFRGDPVPPADGSATSQRLAVEPVPSR